MNASQLVTYLNAIGIGEMDGIQAKLEEAKNACSALGETDLAQIPPRIEPSMKPVPTYEPRVALGHPAQNLHYASSIANALNAIDLGAQLLALSEAIGPVQPKFTTAPSSPANL